MAQDVKLAASKVAESANKQQQQRQQRQQDEDAAGGGEDCAGTGKKKGTAGSKADGRRRMSTFKSQQLESTFKLVHHTHDLMVHAAATLHHEAGRAAASMGRTGVARRHFRCALRVKRAMLTSFPEEAEKAKKEAEGASRAGGSQAGAAAAEQAAKGEKEEEDRAGKKARAGPPAAAAAAASAHRSGVGATAHTTVTNSVASSLLALGELELKLSEGPDAVPDVSARLHGLDVALTHLTHALEMKETVLPHNDVGLVSHPLFLSFSLFAPLN